MTSTTLIVAGDPIASRRPVTRLVFRAGNLLTVPRLEEDEQAAIRGLLGAAGFVVRNLSQKRASKQSEGLADLAIHHRRLKRAGWFECKKLMDAGFNPVDPRTWRPEPLRPDQAAFREDCLACGQLYGWGSIFQAEEFLEGLGLGVRRNGTFWLQRAR